MTAKLIEVHYSCAHRIMGVFDDKVYAEVDLSHLLRRKLFRPLRDNVRFRAVTFDAAGQRAVWPNGACVSAAEIRHLHETQGGHDASDARWRKDHYWFTLDSEFFDEDWSCVTAPEWAGTPFAYRRLFFEFHRTWVLDLPRTCPCCGYPTLEERVCNNRCSICEWFDDGQDDPYAYDMCQDMIGMSLAQARHNFADACTSYSLEYSPGEEHFDRLFSHTAIAQRRAQCALYDSLLAAADSNDLKQRWKKIKHLVPGVMTDDRFDALYPDAVNSVVDFIHRELAEMKRTQ